MKNLIRRCKDVLSGKCRKNKAKARDRTTCVIQSLVTANAVDRLKPELLKFLKEYEMNYSKEYEFWSGLLSRVQTNDISPVFQGQALAKETFDVVFEQAEHFSHQKSRLPWMWLSLTAHFSEKVKFTRLLRHFDTHGDLSLVCACVVFDGLRGANVDRVWFFKEMISCQSFIKSAKTASVEELRLVLENVPGFTAELLNSEVTLRGGVVESLVGMALNRAMEIGLTEGLVVESERENFCLESLRPWVEILKAVRDGEDRHVNEKRKVAIRRLVGLHCWGEEGSIECRGQKWQRQSLRGSLEYAITRVPKPVVDVITPWITRLSEGRA